MNTLNCRNAGRRAALLALCLGLAACATLAPSTPPRVDVVGIEPLAGQGLELRLAVKLRVLNPNDAPLQYDGVFVEMDVRGQSFASGISNERGTVPRYGETVLTIPVTVAAMAALRQALGIAGGDHSPISYQVRGKLSGPVFTSHSFRSDGEFKLPAGLIGH
jgi:LEA14-like dessication related protein